MRKLYITFLSLLAIIFVSCGTRPDQKFSLAGTWGIRLDPDDVGIAEGWAAKPFDQTIRLPGTTDEANLGARTRDTAYGILSREYEYIGPAWYSKAVQIPESWEEKVITLFLERVLWESQVFIDGKHIGTQDALGTPHIHELGRLKAGRHELCIRINNDMIHNIGDKGHAYGDYMQSIWNGVVGNIELRANDRIHFDGLRLFPDIKTESVLVEMKVDKPKGTDLEYVFRIREKGSGEMIFEETHQSSLEEINIILKPEQEITLWNEFNPFIYELEVLIDPYERLDFKTYDFGFAEVSRTDHKVVINGDKVFLRGNLDCIHFPKTGNPAMDVKSWKKIFRTYKKYGLNHVRFHSWCPPEAAFEAADEVGIYIQAEASVWIDWWMGTDMVARGRPEMDTKGNPQGIGRGDKDADEFIRAEMQRVVDTYGNHPSFIMFCIGNELGSSDFDVMGEWIKELKEYDPRRLYAASTARTITEYCDYSATHNVPGVGGVRQRMYNHTKWDYEDKYSQCNVPIIAHEIGQWPVYPDWDEIDKYTGVLKPRNLEQLENIAKETGLWKQNPELNRASGKLSALLYKDEIEAFLRTPSCGGYQLLSMQDYIGQGEAVIGWLDSFYEPKGNLDPEEARHFINYIVPLLELPKYNWIAGEKVEVGILLHQYANKDLKNQDINCYLQDSEGNVLFKEIIKGGMYAKGMLHELGSLVIPAPDVDEAGACRITLELPGTLYKNSWPVWVYPDGPIVGNEEVIVKSEFDKEAVNLLEQESKVLLIANESGDPDSQINAAFKPLYWSASFFPGQSIETLGAIVDNEHPALSLFPGDDFTSWNWWNLCEGAKAFDLSEAPEDLKPIVQPVSDFHFSKRLGSIFEVKAGQGKLLVCGYDISVSRNSLVEVRQLRQSLIRYMKSDYFDPEVEVGIEFLTGLFPHYESASTEVPPGFEDAGLYLEAAANQENDGNSSWSPDIDRLIKRGSVKYTVKAGGCWKDDVGTAWFGKEMEIKLSVPAGAIGKVFLFCHDWSNQNRDGSVDVENRKFSIGKHDGPGKWISLDYMREDTQDGEIKIRIKSTNGPNIMVSKVAVFTN